MSEVGIIIKPSDFDRMVNELKSTVKDELQNIRGMMVEKPIFRKEAAEFLGIHITTLERRLKKGIIPARLIHYNGDTAYFLPSELHQFIKQS